MRYLLFPLLMLSACASAPVQDEKISAMVFIQMSDGSEFVAGSRITLSVYDGGLADTSMRPIHTLSQSPNVNAAALVQSLLIPKEPYSRLSIPSYSIRVEKNGTLVGINMSAIRVDLSKQPQTLLVDKVN